MIIQSRIFYIHFKHVWRGSLNLNNKYFKNSQILSVRNVHVIIVSVWFFSLCWASSWEVSCYIFVSPLGGTAMNRRWGTASFFPHMNTLLVHNIRLARLTSLNIIICFVQSSATVQSDLTLSSTTVLTVMRHNGQILYEWSFPLGETGSVCVCVCGCRGEGDCIPVVFSYLSYQWQASISITSPTCLAGEWKLADSQ